MCRVRGSSLAPSSVTTTVTPTSTVVAASESMTAAPTTTSTPAAAVSSSSDGAAYVEALAASSSTTTEAAATYNAAAYAAPSAATASATTSSASVAAAVSTSSGGGNGKLGAAWPNGDWASPSDPDYIGNYIGSKTNWYYTWSPFNVVSERFPSDRIRSDGRNREPAMRKVWSSCLCFGDRIRYRTSGLSSPSGLQQFQMRSSSM